MVAALSPDLARRLARKKPLSLDARRPIAIKRSVHDVVIGTDATRFAEALQAIMSGEAPSFATIDIRRARASVGRPFVVGERFTGAVRLGRVVRSGGGRAWRRILAALAGARWVRWLEDALLSDYAEVSALDLDPLPGQPYRVAYRYLEGTPMAGHSTLLVEPIDAGRCRFRCIFEYQELGALPLEILQRFGVRVHDEVTRAQAELAAARAGATILASTLPPS